ncbi:MAG TPA: SAM-dependent methyltransferase [Stellaceae bacterium]|nr:SAM-dependent methyltransferase [Stellaceae bacterium]
MTPLGSRLAAEIRASGPIGVDHFMGLALGDPEHGYYSRRDPLGVAGDFTTAPEISQVFGEIIGAWLADSWRAMGSPDPVLLVELGPGRGTLAADILRTFRIMPACRAAARLHLVETSPALRERQRATLGGEPVWHDALDTVPDGPMLLVANEFFDALPIRQFVYSGNAWHERLVGLDATGELVFVLGAAAAPPPPIPLPQGEGGRRGDLPLPLREGDGGRGQPPEGAVFEICEPARDIATAIGRRLAVHRGAALIIDYGHGKQGFGETLQAVRAHRYAPVLDDPGEVDITAHVDFAALGAALAPAAVWGPVTQERFLAANGVALREAALTRGTHEATATAIRRAVRRLLDPAAMGRLFKVLAATSPGLPCPAGF